MNKGDGYENGLQENSGSFCSPNHARCGVSFDQYEVMLCLTIYMYKPFHTSRPGHRV